MNKSRIDRLLEMEQSLRAADIATKNSAMASAKRLEEKRIAAEHEVAQLEIGAETLGLIGLVSPYRCPRSYLDEVSERFGASQSKLGFQPSRRQDTDF